MLRDRCLLLAACCLRFKSPERAEQRNMAVAQAVGEVTGQPASKQAFLQLSAREEQGTLS